jgi:hypothetical protein
VASLQSQVNVINTTISGLPTTSDLDGKASTSHSHTVSDISDISSAYYNKTQTDVLLSNVQPSAHTHTESEITDLDKYTKAQTDLKFTDHNNLTNNPHNVTKAQVSLGNVENLSVADLFATPQAQAFATDVELQAVSLASSTHISSTNNPHNVTKAQVSLGNVPNINFQSLLDTHLNASNPHNINLTYFDVYSRAETDTRVVHYIDTLRYAFKPTTPTDGAGAVGDIAYDNTGLYFKFGATDWRQILASKTFNDGSAGSKFEIETPKFEITTAGGTNLFAIDSTTNTTSINTAIVSIGGATSIDNTLNVTGAVSLGGDTNISGQVSISSGLTTQGAVSINNTLNVSAHSILSTLRATTATVDSLDSGSGVIQTTGQILGGATTVTSLSAGSGAISTTGTLSTGGATVTSLSAGSGSISTTGTLSTGGATVTSLSAGSGEVSTTGAIKGGTIEPNNKVKAQTGDLILEGKDGDDVQVNDILKVINNAEISGSTTIGTSSVNANLVVNGNTTISGDLTINGTTTTIDTTNLLIEDNMVVLNKNQTGTPPTTLDSGIEVERGNSTNAKLYWDEAADKWKVNLGGTVKTLAFTEDAYSQ